jgi:hypothetical protein
MATNIERASRWIAMVALVASAFFFGWYGLHVGRAWPAALPFFGGFVLAWLAALLGIARRRFWGQGYAAGLSLLSLSLLAPAANHAAVALFVGTQLALLGALGVRAMAEMEQAETEERSWRHGALAFTSGLAMPWLLAAGLLPGGGVWGLVAMVGAGLAVLGSSGAFRNRTWGLLAMVGAIPLLLAIPPFTWGCIRAPHDVAGEVASLTLAAGVLSWIAPMFAALRHRASR